MRIRLAMAAGTVAALAAAAPAVASTHPNARGSIGLSLGSGQVRAGAPFTVSVSSAHVGGSRLYLQRTAGSANTFRNIARAPKRGAFAAPGVPMGGYTYRVVAIKHRRIIAASAGRSLFSYGPVSSYDVCNQSKASEWGDCERGTISVGSRVFNYNHDDGNGNTGPTAPYANVKAQRSSCRSLSADFAMPNTSYSHPATVGAAASTTNSDLQQATGAYGTVAHANFALTSPSWNLTFWTDNGTAEVYWTGTFSCWTPSGEY